MKIPKGFFFFLLVFFLILTPLISSMLPFFVQSIKTPPDRVFMGLHRWSEDYYSYLHLINQGINGHLMTVNKITNEPHIPTFVHSEYSFLGLAGRLLGINSVLTYHLSRLILGAIFLLTTFYLLLNTLSSTKKALVAFFLAFFVGSLPNGLSWWVELDPTRRSTILPHYLMGSILMLLIFTLILKNKKFFSLASCFLLLASFLLAFVHPVDFMMTAAILALYSVLTKNLRQLLFLLPGLIPILYFRYVFTLPFYRFVAEHGATTLYKIPLTDFVLALGPVFFLATCYLGLGTWNLVHKTKFSQFTVHSSQFPVILMFSWLIVQTFFFLKGYQLLNFDRLRSLHAPFFIPLAFFATLFLRRIEKRIGFLNSSFLILASCFLITLPLSIQSIYRQIYEVSDFKTFSTFSYPSQKTYEAFLFLKNNTPENSLITTGYEARFLLPAVANNRVVFGANFENDPEYQKNVEKITQMYQGQLSGANLKQFLNLAQIKFIYWGYQEKSYGKDLTKENFLQKIFDNGEVTVFAVK